MVGQTGGGYARGRSATLMTEGHMRVKVMAGPASRHIVTRWAITLP
jgi:hypothetical protein